MPQIITRVSCWSLYEVCRLGKGDGLGDRGSLQEPTLPGLVYRDSHKVAKQMPRRDARDTLESEAALNEREFRPIPHLLFDFA